MKIQYESGVTVELIAEGTGWVARVDDRVHRFQTVEGPSGVRVLAFDDGTVVSAAVVGSQVAVGGHEYALAEAATRTRRGQQSDQNGLQAPMPGTVLQVRVSEGEDVTSGQTLVVLEAMKMEHAIKAPRDGKVRRIPYEVGARVGPGDALVELE